MKTITQVDMHGFKEARNVSVPLYKLTYICGPNGSGKTRVLDAIRLVSTKATIGTSRKANSQTPTTLSAITAM